jgi:hypothetical protein
MEGGKLVTSVESSSDRNSKLLKAVLNISSVIEEPLVFKGDASPPPLFASLLFPLSLRDLSCTGKRFLLHSFKAVPSMFSLVVLRLPLAMAHQSYEEWSSSYVVCDELERAPGVLIAPPPLLPQFVVFYEVK